MAASSPEVLYADAMGYRRVGMDHVLVLVRQFTNYALRWGKWLDEGFDKEWSYPPEAFPHAALALAEWDGKGDPPDGWTRSYPPYYRRRPDGTPESEYQAP